MASSRVLFVDERHVEALRIAHQRMREARVLYEGLSRLIVEEILTDPEILALGPVDATLDADRCCVTVVAKEQPTPEKA